jgi:FkbM family methyltransferase
MKNVREWVKSKVVSNFPQLYLDSLIWRIGYPDPELYLLPSLCEEAKCSVDVGSCVGDYAFHMLRHSKHCHVFEPRPDAVETIRRCLEGTSFPMTVHEIALSDAEGEMPLRVTPECAERSTLETSNQLEDFDEDHVTVPVRRLDDSLVVTAGPRMSEIKICSGKAQAMGRTRAACEWARDARLSRDRQVPDRTFGTTSRSGDASSFGADRHCPPL